MLDYIAKAREVIERSEAEPEAYILFEEFHIPLMLELIDRLDKIIELLPSTSSSVETLV